MPERYSHPARQCRQDHRRDLAMAAKGIDAAAHDADAGSGTANAIKGFKKKGSCQFGYFAP